ncbi:MurR/RpiR family transcriptional regulator [Lentilitoribacter sp. Alg239-R112]|uniref:MurR/RpiR family transcriptional regulator n=1 Tax=Lentilitoribacter sp. Alg239-R112 TaxID=2305987 RepID=UPI0013A695C9|nr:MurR/RpiR family transcriptional regulator [Lentilitoribacter sp. Alg239-R112]
MSLIKTISDSAQALTPNERRLVQSVIDSPANAALGTASELAKAVGVHEATASRLAKKLGFNSYADFRNALRDEFIVTNETATRFEKTIAENDSQTILGNLALQESDALSNIENFITADQVNRVAEALMNSERIFIQGSGNAEVLALMMTKRFRRFGKDVHLLGADPRSLAEQTLGLRKGDIILTFVFRRSPSMYAPLMETAHEVGAQTIVIAGASGAMAFPSPDFILAAPRSGDPDAFQTLTVPMTVCNAIIIAAGLTSRKASLTKLERLGKLIERFQ